MQHPREDVTVLLQAWAGGSSEALERLIPLVYDELRLLARRHVRSEHELNSVNATALVHEAYMRLVDIRSARFRDRAHFLSMASRIMRRLLVDHARARNAARRGGGAAHVELHDDLAISDVYCEQLTELDDALQRLETIDERQCRILEQRFFGGLTLEETAEAVGMSLATVKRELRFARAWLAAQLDPGHAGT